MVFNKNTINGVSNERLVIDVSGSVGIGGVTDISNIQLAIISDVSKVAIPNQLIDWWSSLYLGHPDAGGGPGTGGMTLGRVADKRDPGNTKYYNAIQSMWMDANGNTTHNTGSSQKEYSDLVINPLGGNIGIVIVFIGVPIGIFQQMIL